MTHQRGDSFQSWLKSQFSGQVFTIESLTGDAGFRRYYRLQFTNHTLIAVDAPPDKSNNTAFICIAKQLALHGVIAPKVIVQDIEQGFFCLTDLGNTLLSDVVNLVNYYQQLESQKKIIDQEASHIDGENPKVNPINIFFVFFIEILRYNVIFITNCHIH